MLYDAACYGESRDATLVRDEAERLAHVMFSGELVMSVHDDGALSLDNIRLMPESAALHLVR